jgi:hypothetical protein
MAKTILSCRQRDRYERAQAGELFSADVPLNVRVLPD